MTSLPKLKIWILSLLITLWAPFLAQAKPDWFTPTPAYERQFTIAHNILATLKTKRGWIQVQVLGHEDSVYPYLDSLNHEGQTFVDVQDFNFDGFADLSIFDSEGYSGVNLFTTVYLYNPAQNNFAESITGSNLKPDAEQKKVFSYMKTASTGLQFVSAEYHVANSALYKAVENATLTEPCVAERKTFKPSGEIQVRGLYDSCRGDDFDIKPERVVKIEKSFLYDKPEENAKTTKYLIRSDKVKLLQIDGSQMWYFVEFQGKKTVQAWVKIADLGQIPGSEGL